MVAVAGVASAAWLLAGGDISIVPAALPLRSPGPLTVGQSSGAAPVAGGVPLRAASWPADAQVLVDGQALGTTPLVTAVLPGPHRVTLRHSGALEATREVDVPAASGSGGLLNLGGQLGRRWGGQEQPAGRFGRAAEAEQAAQLSLPLSAGVAVGRGYRQEMLPLSLAYPE